MSALKQQRLKTSFAINIVGTGIPVVVALLTVPLYVSHIGTTRYGVLAIVWILLGYFGFIDLGLSRASANALARNAFASKKERIGILVTSFYLNLGLGLTGGILLYLCGRFLLNKGLTLTGPVAAELDAAFPWIAGMLPLLLLYALCRGAIESKERFFVSNLIDIVGYVSGQILPLLAAILIAPTLPIVLTAAFVARALAVLIAMSFVIFAEKINTIRIFDQKQLRDLVSFGAWASVTSIISPILQFIDQLLVGSMHGAAAVAYYAIPMNLVIRSQVIAMALARATFPRFSRINQERAIDLGEQSAVSLSFVYGAICAAAVVFSKAFMTLWIGKEFASEAAPILEVLLLGAWINGIAFIPYSLLQGQGRPHVVAKLHIAEIFPYLLLLWLMLTEFGVFGAAIAWSLRVTIDAVLLMKLAGFRVRNVKALIFGLILMLASYATALKIENATAISSFALAVVFFLAFAIGAMTLDTNLRRVAFGWRHWR